MPADAELALQIAGGIGVSLAIARAVGGIEAEGAAGLKGRVVAAADIAYDKRSARGRRQGRAVGATKACVPPEGVRPRRGVTSSSPRSSSTRRSGSSPQFEAGCGAQGRRARAVQVRLRPAVRAVARPGRVHRSPDRPGPVRQGAVARMIDSPPASRELNNEAFRLMLAGRLDQARAGFGRSLEVDPLNATALSNLGFLLTQLGELDEAISTLERATAADPCSPAAANNLGNALFAGGRCEDAIASYHRALAIDKSNAQARLNVAIAHHQCGRPSATRSTSTASTSRAVRTTGALTTMSRSPTRLRVTREGGPFIPGGGLDCARRAGVSAQSRWCAVHGG